MKNSEQNFLPLHMATPWQKLPISMMLSQNVLNWKQAQLKVYHRQQQKEKKRRKRKGEKKIQKSKSLMSMNVIKNVIKHDASGKKGMLLCCKCLFGQIGANLADNQTKNV